MGATDTTPDGRSSRWDEHRLARRQELVEATLHAIREHGAGVGMDEVAATARTSKTVFYRHFTDRAGLYTAVAERVDATIIRDLSRAAGDPATDDARAVIRGVIAAYLRLVEDDPEVYRFIVNAPMVPPGERPQGDVAAGMTDRIASHVADLVAGGLAEPVRPAALGRGPRRHGAGDGRRVARGRWCRRRPEQRRARRRPHRPRLGRPVERRGAGTGELTGSAASTTGAVAVPLDPLSYGRTASTW